MGSSSIAARAGSATDQISLSYLLSRNPELLFFWGSKSCGWGLASALLVVVLVDSSSGKEKSLALELQHVLRLALLEGLWVYDHLLLVLLLLGVDTGSL